MDPPSYIALLHAIVRNESDNAILFAAWAEHTRDAGAREVLALVAARELEHASTFAVRSAELGAPVADDADRRAEVLRGRIAIATADLDDLTKFEQLGFGAPRPDVFGSYFDDTSIDIETGALLGRFIVEERDSARRIDKCCAALRG